MDERFRARLDFVVGGTPSRFMMHEADWERLYKLVIYAAGLAPSDRPSEAELRESLADALPRRPEWADEVLLAYRHALALLDYMRREGVERPAAIDRWRKALAATTGLDPSNDNGDPHKSGGSPRKPVPCKAMSG